MTARIGDDVIEKIRELQAQGLGTTAIAKKLSVSLSATGKYKKLLGVQGLRILPEKQILELLKKGDAPRTIAQRLGVSYRRTQTFAHQNGFGKPRKELSKAQLKLLTADILKREASALALTRKYRCSYKTVLALAHDLLQCTRFLPSWRTPLSSYLPAKYFDRKTGQ